MIMTTAEMSFFIFDFYFPFSFVRIRFFLLSALSWIKCCKCSRWNGVLSNTLFEWKLRISAELHFCVSVRVCVMGVFAYAEEIIHRCSTLHDHCPMHDKLWHLSRSIWLVTITYDIGMAIGHWSWRAQTTRRSLQNWSLEMDYAIWCRPLDELTIILVCNKRLPATAAVQCSCVCIDRTNRAPNCRCCACHVHDKIYLLILLRFRLHRIDGKEMVGVARQHCSNSNKIIACESLNWLKINCALIKFRVCIAISLTKCGNFLKISRSEHVEIDEFWEQSTALTDFLHIFLQFATFKWVYVLKSDDIRISIVWNQHETCCDAHISSVTISDWTCSSSLHTK